MTNGSNIRVAFIPDSTPKMGKKGVTKVTFVYIKRVKAKTGSPPGIRNMFKQIVSVSILNGFERSIQLWIGNDTYNFTKIAAILNFHVNMSPSWILYVFGPFLKYNIFLLHVHHCPIIRYKF